MKCARCLRTIRRAYYTQGASTFGPSCGKQLGLDLAKQAKTHKVSARIKVEILDGQQQLFEGMPA